MPKHCREVDQPVAGLIKDLKSRGLLEDTLIIWLSEMGRTPFDNNLITDNPGRDHNQYGLVTWFAGGNTNVVPMRGVHATILDLRGLDQHRLTVLHVGRNKKLAGIGGRAISEIIAT